MGTLTIKINDSNSAFEDEGATTEIARILQTLITRLEQIGDHPHADLISLPLYDCNGNKVGESYYIRHPDDDY